MATTPKKKETRIVETFQTKRVPETSYDEASLEVRPGFGDQSIVFSFNEQDLKALIERLKHTDEEFIALYI